MDPSLPVLLNIIIQYFWVLQSFAFSSSLLSLLPLALSTQISLLKQSLGKAYVNSPQVIKCENKGWTKNSLREMKRTGFFFFFTVSENTHLLTNVFSPFPREESSCVRWGMRYLRAAWNMHCTIVEFSASRKHFEMMK